MLRGTDPRWTVAREHGRSRLPKYQGTPYGDKELLEPGDDDEDARPYPLLPPWGWTSVLDLGEFGLGIGLYFGMLRDLAIVFVVVGLVNLPSMMYFASKAYNGGISPDESAMIPHDLVSSAVCLDRLKVRTSAVDEHHRELVPCMYASRNWILDLVSTLLLLIVNNSMGRVQDAKAEALDESTQTAQDYSIVVQDPDPHATDCDKWRAFFDRVLSEILEDEMRLDLEPDWDCAKTDEGVYVVKNQVTDDELFRYDGAGVVAVTVARNNAELLKLLREHKQLEYKLALDVGEFARRAYDAARTADGGVDDRAVKEESEDAVGHLLKAMHGVRAKIECECRRLLTEGAPAVKVFVAFEHEEFQRKVLEKLSTGHIPAYLEKSQLDAKYRYEGTNVLKIEEAPEPTDVSFLDLDTSLVRQAIEQTTTLLGLITLLTVLTLFIFLLSKTNPVEVALFISLCNSVLPKVCKALNHIEHHPTVGHREASLLLKLVFARWFNTAVILYIVTPKKDTLATSNLAQIAALLWADALTTPTLRLLNVFAVGKRILLGPLAKTQLKMNSYFRGTPWTVAERYTDMSKTIFVALFFAPIYPMAYWILAFALLYNFFVDKYCLLRVWTRKPEIDSSITRATRMHFSFAILVHVVVATHYYASWPFDDLADPADDGSDVYREVDAECWPSLILCKWDRDWMPPVQQHATEAFSVCSLILVIVMSLQYFGLISYYGFKSLFFGLYKAVGDVQGVGYWVAARLPTGMDGYVPQFENPTGEPYLACDIDGFDREFIPWTGDHDSACLFNDPLMCARARDVIDIGNVTIDLSAESGERPWRGDASIRAKLFSTLKMYETTGKADAEAISARILKIHDKDERRSSWEKNMLEKKAKKMRRARSAKLFNDQVDVRDINLAPGWGLVPKPPLRSSVPGAPPPPIFGNPMSNSPAAMV